MYKELIDLLAVKFGVAAKSIPEPKRTQCRKVADARCMLTHHLYITEGLSGKEVCKVVKYSHTQTIYWALANHRKRYENSEYYRKIYNEMLPIFMKDSSDSSDLSDF